MTAADTCVGLRARFVGDHALFAPDGANIMPTANKKAAAILAYLIIHRGKAIPRPELIALCWSDRGKQQGQDSLRQAVRTIGHSLEPRYRDLLIRERGTLRWSDAPACLQSDFLEGQRKIIVGQTGPLLAGLDGITEEVDAWLRAERRRFTDVQIGLAERIIHEAGAETAAAREAADHILALDPEHEGAVRTVMKSCANDGELPRALKLFQRLEASLAERGFAVSTQTREVLAELRPRLARSGAPLAYSAIAATGAPPAVACAGLSALDAPDSSARPIALMNEDLANRLAQVREFRTLSGGQTKGAEYTLGGHVSGVRGALRVTAHLTATRKDERIWSFTRTVPFGDADVALSEFVEQVVGAVVSEVEKDQRALLPQTPREDWSAYHYYLAGKTAIIHATNANYLIEAEPAFEKAIALDPDFLPAYPVLIASYNSARRHTSPGLDWQEGNVRATELLRRLLMRDSRFPNAHVSKAWCLMRRRQFDLAEQALEEAVALGPYEPARFNAIGTAYVYLGDLERGAYFYDMADRRMTHDLDYQMTDRGELHYFRREYETALQFLDIGELSNPLQPKCFRCATLAQLGRLGEASAEAAEVVEMFRTRWAGPQPFSARAALTWYLQGFTFRRQMDFDNFVEGLTKAGLIL